MYSYVKEKIFIFFRKLYEYNAKREISKIPFLDEQLKKYLKNTKSTGCSYSDYWELYKAIRKRKPKQILECGTGVSTIVIACALIKNNEEGYKGKLTSLEEVEEYFELSKKLLPKFAESIVEIVCRPRKDSFFSIYRGVCYSDVPEKKYDFVFVDGPNYVSTNDKMVTFDFDMINVIKKSKNPVYGMVDKRVSTCYVLQKLLGKEIVKYNSIKHVCHIGPCSNKDLKLIDKDCPSSSFSKSFKILSNSELELN